MWWSADTPELQSPTEPSGPQRDPSPVASVQIRESQRAMVNQQAILGQLRAQMKAGVRYSDKYYRIAYPMGDVPPNVGVSTDVVVRSLRAIGMDLQELIFKDKTEFPDQYPQGRWAEAAPDPSVEHRRVVNLAIYLERHFKPLPLTRWDTYEAGDVVLWRIGNGEYPDHVGIVTDQRDSQGIPLAAELNPQAGKLSARTPANMWPIRGHFRVEARP